MKKHCLSCGQEMQGRADKRFCSLPCKNAYNNEQRRQSRGATEEIDSYLHRNREVLALLMGETKKASFDRLTLQRAGFKFEYHTGVYFNKEGKMYRIVYDFAWMDFSDQSVLIVRKK
jgi:predicted nucleic acid-binding Zn ribbon protein